jgi:hypothetical protein
MRIVVGWPASLLKLQSSLAADQAKLGRKAKTVEIRVKIRRKPKIVEIRKLVC